MGRRPARLPPAAIQAAFTSDARYADYMRDLEPAEPDDSYNADDGDYREDRH